MDSPATRATVPSTPSNTSESSSIVNDTAVINTTAQPTATQDTTQNAPTTTPTTTPPNTTPNTTPSTNNPFTTSATPSANTTPQPSSNTPPANNPATTQAQSSPSPPVVVISSTAQVQTSTEVYTSIITQTPTDGGPATTIVVIGTSLNSQQSETASHSTSSSTALSSTNHSSASSGLSAAGKTAIAVVIPIAVIALLIIAGVFWWRRRKQNRNAAEERRREMEAYQYNPNDDPNLPGAAMTMKDPEESSGYRGWQGASGLGRKASTNASTGVSASSPTAANYMVDQHGRNGTMSTEHTFSNLNGAAPMTALGAAGGVLPTDRRVSNASSRYSQADGNMAASAHEDYSMSQHSPFHGESYSHVNPYYPTGSYDNYASQPVLRESPARKLTQQSAERSPTQGGISQNF